MRPAFTLAELLVVIGIIALLVSVLLPVIGKVRIVGQTADTSALIRAIDAACQTYYQDHTAWPGPLRDVDLGIDGSSAWKSNTPTLVDSGVPIVGTAGDGFYRPGGNLEGVTGAENLVLGLLGGLIPVEVATGPSVYEISYDPAAVGRGPLKLNPARSPGGHNTYMDISDQDLSMHIVGTEEAGQLSMNAGERAGRFFNEAGFARDSIVPEFLDRYSDRLPILYLRAQVTSRVAPVAGYATAATNDFSYNLNGVLGYVGWYAPPGGGATTLAASYAGAGASPLSAEHEQNGTFHGLVLDADFPPPLSGGTLDQTDIPFAAEYYLASPSGGSTSQPAARQTDRYVLISAGADRIYGTADDVTNFGSVK